MPLVKDTDLPRYQSHKIVRAARIAIAETRSNGAALLSFDDADGSHLVTRPGWIERFTEEPSGDLGYYVVYEDGFTSWSPTYAFEAGYTRLDT
jgi:hypothetical protein